MENIKIIKGIKKVIIDSVTYTICSANVLGNLLFILKYKTDSITNYIYSNAWENDFIDGNKKCDNYSDYNWTILSQVC